MTASGRRIATCLAWAAALCLACVLARAADQRVALLIGNNTYAGVPLANAVNDARDLAGALRNLGFKTIVRENATRRDMIEALREFGDSIGEADAAVFFYAGHALQFKDRNYLLPVDSEIRSEEDISLFSVEIQQVFDRMDRARTRHNVIILDACRDNPFAGTFKVSSPGLAQPSAPSGTLVAYATAPGSVAADGFGRNGMYTKHILQHIADPDLPVELMFKRVREGVEKETQHRQTPWDSSSMKGDFSFNNGRGAAAPAGAVARTEPSVDMMLQIERDFWLTVRDSNRVEELQAYLDTYPNGKFVALARLRLQQAGSPGPQLGPQLAPQMPPTLRMQPRGLELPGKEQKPDSPAGKSSWLAPPRLWNVALEEGRAPAAISIEDFYRKAQVQEMRLSPDGSSIAVILPIGGHMGVAVLDLARRQAKPVAHFEDSDVTWVRWISNRRLLVQSDSEIDRLCGCRLGGLMAVDLDGGEPRVLSETFKERAGHDVLTVRFLLFVSTVPGDSDDFIAQEYVGAESGVSGSSLYRVNSRTGRRTLMSLGKPDTGEAERWVLDSHAVPRIFLAIRKGTTAIYYRASADAPWALIEKVDSQKRDWWPLGIAEDGSIYAGSSRGRDKTVIVQVEPRPGGDERVVALHPYVDVADLIFDDGKPVGIAYNADRPGFAWMDEELERIQVTVDKALPNSTNVLSWSRNRERVMVRSSSDRLPGTYYLFDRTTGKIQWLSDRKPWLKRESLAQTIPVRYKARDGMDVPAYFTLPDGPVSRRPLVVLVHDDPFSQGSSWGFDAEVQQLAAEGYAVLQPNYRGTTRYGKKYHEAGIRQWGRAIQDDIADGVAWAVSRGYADKDRVCIYGGQFGGYSALMGLIRTPEIYRCGVAYMGYVDLLALFDKGWSPMAGSDNATHGMRQMIGDPDSDRAGLLEISPVEQAARIQAPALLAFGSDDLMVPLQQAERLRTALERNHKKFDWLVLEGEGHYFGEPAARIRFQRAASRFLAENLRAPEVTVRPSR